MFTLRAWNLPKQPKIVLSCSFQFKAPILQFLKWFFLIESLIDVLYLLFFLSFLHQLLENLPFRSTNNHITILHLSDMNWLVFLLFICPILIEVEEPPPTSNNFSPPPSIINSFTLSINDLMQIYAYRTFPSLHQQSLIWLPNELIPITQNHFKLTYFSLGLIITINSLLPPLLFLAFIILQLSKQIQKGG